MQTDSMVSVGICILSLPLSEFHSLCNWHHISHA